MPALHSKSAIEKFGDKPFIALFKVAGAENLWKK
jgi:hypothetical protein